MNVEVKKFSKGSAKKWDEYVIQNKGTSFYHQIGWKNVIEDTYGHKAYYLYAEDDDGSIIGIFPTFLIKSLLFGRRIVSIPFAPYGGLCCKNDDVSNALLNGIINIGRDFDVSGYEFRSSPLSSSYGFTSHPYHRYDFSQHVTFYKDLSDGTEHIWNNIDKKIRNLVRKGIKNNLHFEINEYSRENVKLFYAIYLDNMKSLGTPVHSFDFFNKLGQTFPKDVFIANVKLSNKIIVSLYLMTFKNIVLSGWGASLNHYLEYSPNNFIYWNALQWASEKNYSYFDFGRSQVDSGTYYFKQKWRGSEISLTYSHFCENKTEMKDIANYKSYSKIWKKIPLPLTRALGPAVRKYIV